MKILSIDTSITEGSVALSEDLKLVAEERQGGSGTHTELLIPSIDRLLGLARWKISDVEAIAVAIGPGSFTGLRTGLATAKGLAVASSCKIVGVSSLESLAYNGLGEGGTVVALIDARRGELYAAAYAFRDGGVCETVIGECVLSPRQLTERLKSIGGELFLVGDGAIAYADRLRRSLGTQARIPERVRCLPRAINLARIAYNRLSDGYSDDIVRLVPNYIRRSDAEIGFMGASKKKVKK